MLQLLSQHPLLIYIQKDCVLIEAVPESSLVAFLYPHVVQWEWEIGEKAETELTEIEVYSVLRNGFGQYNTEYYWGHEDGQRRGTPAGFLYNRGALCSRIGRSVTGRPCAGGQNHAYERRDLAPYGYSYWSFCQISTPRKVTLLSTEQAPFMPNHRTQETALRTYGEPVSYSRAG